MWGLRELIYYSGNLTLHLFDTWYDFNIGLNRLTELDPATMDIYEEIAEDLLRALTNLLEQHRRVCRIVGVPGIPTMDIEG